MTKKKITQAQLIIEYYMSRPNEDVPHQEAVDWLSDKWEKETGGKFRDVDRGIRKLSQAGFLIKVQKGVYRYDPDPVHHPELWDFTQTQKEEIKKRDNYRCVVCGLGEKEGEELHVDHIKPKDRGGLATIENGQTLCSRHNLLKKNFKQTETGKKMFIRLYELAKAEGDEGLVTFCREILEMFERHQINGHIDWKR